MTFFSRYATVIAKSQILVLHLVEQHMMPIFGESVRYEATWRVSEIKEKNEKMNLAARELHYWPETAGKIIGSGIDVPELTEDELQAERSWQIPVQSATMST